MPTPEDAGFAGEEFKRGFEEGRPGMFKTKARLDDEVVDAVIVPTVERELDKPRVKVGMTVQYRSDMSFAPRFFAAIVLDIAQDGLTLWVIPPFLARVPYLLECVGYDPRGEVAGSWRFLEDER